MALEGVVSIKGRRLTGRAGLKLTLQVLLAATVLATVGLLAIVAVFEKQIGTLPGLTGQPKKAEPQCGRI